MTNGGFFHEVAERFFPGGDGSKISFYQLKNKQYFSTKKLNFKPKGGPRPVLFNRGSAKRVVGFHESFSFLGEMIFASVC